MKKRVCNFFVFFNGFFMILPPVWTSKSDRKVVIVFDVFPYFMIKGTWGAPRRSGASPGRHFGVPKAQFWPPAGNFGVYLAQNLMDLLLFWHTVSIYTPQNINGFWAPRLWHTVSTYTRAARLWHTVSTYTPQIIKKNLNSETLTHCVNFHSSIY